MPRTIEAIFYQTYSQPNAVAEARKAHTAFLDKFGLSARDVPIVIYDESRASDPFTLARN